MQPLERGLRRVSPERRREIAHLGGVAAHRAGTAHRWTAAEARAAAQRAAANRLARIETPAPVIAAAAIPRDAARDSWVLVGRDGRRLECRTHMIGAGFEVTVGYPGMTLMYSDIYPDIASARRLLADWWEAAIVSGNFLPVSPAGMTDGDDADE